jgi:hypothetical protein
MTLVFRPSDGQLMQVQMGTADLVAIISAARSAYGWLSGLKTVQRLLALLPGIFDQRKATALMQDIPTTPVVVHVLTSNGPICQPFPSDEPAFGEDFGTRLIGMTLCALAHILGGEQAVEMLQMVFLPVFVARKELEEAIFLEIKDNRQQILNEGAARGLTDKFKNAIQSSRLPSWTDRHVYEDKIAKSFFDDAEYVYRFLSWLVDEPRGAYFTRSRAVAHVAICLSEVGYRLGVVESWDGQGQYGRRQDVRSVVLVTGGHHPTDPPLDGECDMEAYRVPVHHYQFSTVGGMISTAFRNRCETMPEVFQTEFEEIWKQISEDMTFQWTTVIQDDHIDRGESGWGPLTAKVVWRAPIRRSSSITLRLASLMFKDIAEHVAWCYEPLARPEALSAIKEKYRHIVDGQEPHAGIVMRYRAITSCIIISMIGQLAPRDFKSVPHAVRWNLLDGDALGYWCRAFNDNATQGLLVGQAVLLLASIHAGYYFELEQALSEETMGEDILYTVGYRNAMYAIIPCVLLHMKPTVDAIGLRCFYGFWANAVARGSGMVVSSRGRNLGAEVNLDRTNANGTALSSPHFTGEPYLSPPVEAGPDVSLYLSIERSTYRIHKQEPELVLSGRIAGAFVGSVSVEQVMGTLINSFNREEACPGHDEQLCVAHVTASRWAEKIEKPVGLCGRYDTFVPVKDDDCWGLLLAGEVSNFGGLLVHGCIQCTASTLHDGRNRFGGQESALVGY